MRVFITLAVLWLALGTGFAQEKTNALRTVRSASRQFIISGVPFADRLDLADVASPLAKVRLDPSVMTVTSERVKQHLLTSLRAPDNWHGRIFVNIRFTTAANRPLDIDPFRAGGWQYRLTVPDEVETNKLVRALVQVMLMEMANREVDNQLAEIPLWLTEGMTRHIFSQAGRELIQQPSSRLMRTEIRLDPLASVRQFIRQGRTLTVHQLGTPTPATLEGENWTAFQNCSHLLVAELLKLRNGPQCLRVFLRQLPGYLNWQLAFLDAFRPHFNSLLNVEKWWALCLANAAGLDQWQGWSFAASTRKLDDLLRIPVLIRQSTNDLPLRTDLPLQKFIEVYDYPTQKNLLANKVSLLRAFRINAAPELLALTGDYLAVLENYLGKRGAAGYDPDGRSKFMVDPTMLLHETQRNLDLLDARRQELKLLKMP